MARGPQHLIQIMATQTCFDLNAALENWRNELNAQPQLTPDNRRELERHLADSMAELRQRGLNEEESFWLAQRRIGQPQLLAKEFGKACPVNVWRGRVFWAAAGMIVFWQLALIIDYIGGIGLHFIPGSGTFYANHWSLISGLPLLLIAILLVKGPLGNFSKLSWLLRGRVRLAAFLIFLSVICSIAQQSLIRLDHPEIHSQIEWGAWMRFQLLHLLGYLEIGAVPLVLMIWLSPLLGQKQQKAPQSC